MTTRRTSMTAVAVIITSIAACGSGSVSFSQTHAAPHPLASRPIEQVDVLNIPPGRGYVEIGTVRTRRLVQRRSNISDPDTVAAMRREAASRGCDGLIVNQAHTELEDLAVCIVYTDSR